MWNARWEMLNDDGLRLILERDQRPASFAEVFESLRDDAEFQLIVQCVLGGCIFQCISVGAARIDAEEALHDPFRVCCTELAESGTRC